RITATTLLIPAPPLDQPRRDEVLRDRHRRCNDQVTAPLPSQGRDAGLERIRGPEHISSPRGDDGPAFGQGGTSGGAANQGDGESPLEATNPGGDGRLREPERTRPCTDAAL